MAFVTVGGIKGGVAKSTVAVHLAVALHRAGESVAMLDADPQGSATRWVRRMGELFPVVGITLGNDPRGAAKAAVRRALEAADIVVADPPPSSREVLRVLCAVADLSIVPTGASAEELHLAARTLELAREEREDIGKPLSALLVATRIPKGTTSGRDAVAALGEFGPAAETVLHARIAWVEAMSAGCTVWDLPASRHADAQREASALVAEIQDRL